VGLVRHPPELAQGHGVLALADLVGRHQERLELAGPEEGCEASGPLLPGAVIAEKELG
jgi:hypothetical protein